MNIDSSTDRRLLFLRRMIWWMPVLAFAIVAAMIVALQQGLVAAILWGLAAAVIVGGAVVLAYFGYKMMLERSTT